VASPTAVSHDPREFEREDRDGRHDDDDVHHFSLTLVCPLVFKRALRQAIDRAASCPWRRVAGRRRALHRHSRVRSGGCI
jgi:hypothetical protein